jgi:hypothetical protein
MLASSAHVATERPTLYLKQLCEHFADATQRHSAQEFEVTFDDGEGFIDFAPVVGGTCRLEARGAELVVEARASNQAALDRVQRIVTKHLERFGRGDGLTVEWSPPPFRQDVGLP